MQIDVNGIKITLTADQLKEIDRQVKKTKFKSPSDINSHEDACEILGIEKTKDTTNDSKLKTIIKAANYLDNGNKEWEADWDNRDQRKNFVYLEKKPSGWVVYSDYDFSYYCAGLGSGFYYKEANTALLIARKFLNPYYVNYVTGKE